MIKDFYSVLSIPRDAKPPQIKARFRELARERHPDRFQGTDKAQAELEFQDITEAFNVLMDPVRRRQHDLELDKPTEQAVHDPRQVARVYINRGVRAYKKGNFPEAADNFERATAAEPQNHQAWHHLALVCSREKRWFPKAQKAIDRACELRPDHIPYLKLAGKVYAQSGMTPRAKQYYNRALELADTDPTIRKALEALGGGRPEKSSTPRGPEDGSEQEKGKTGLFRKIW